MSEQGTAYLDVILSNGYKSHPGALQDTAWKGTAHNEGGALKQKAAIRSIKAGRGVAVDLSCLSLKELLPLLPWRLKNAWFFSARTYADLLGWVIFIQVLVFWRISTM